MGYSPPIDIVLHVERMAHAAGTWQGYPWCIELCPMA